MKNYLDFVARGVERYGEKFDASDLAPQFIPYYESDQRIEILTEYGETLRGRVGVTTGWKPVFIFLLRSDSIGSSITLSNTDKILRIIK